jgi:uncharacterized protein DUF1573
MKSLLWNTLFMVLVMARSALAGPHLTVEERNYDFGIILQGERVEHVFSLKNSGDAPLKIKQVRPSCGCTAVNLSTQTIPPGGSGEIKTTFNSAGFQGKVRKEISVESNDAVAPVYSLTLVGTIREEIEVSPKILEFGKVRVNTPKTLEFTIDNRSKVPMIIQSLKPSMPQAEVKGGKNAIFPGESATFSVTVTPRETDRVISGYIGLTTNFPTKRSFSVPFFGSPYK